MRMQLTGSILILGALCASLAACSRGGPATATALPYEVVTVERPESVAAYHQFYKAEYGICANIRSSLHLAPPAPMKEPPADYISKRTTYTSDGTAYLVKEEHFLYKVSVDEPAFTCATYREDTSNTQLVQGGIAYDVAVDAAGNRTTTPPGPAALPRQRRGDTFTVPKTVKGQAVMCMPMLAHTDELITDVCVADLKPGTLVDAGGRPIILASRVTGVQKAMGVILTEPVSVVVGKKIDPAVFAAAAVR